MLNDSCEASGASGSAVVGDPEGKQHRCLPSLPAPASDIELVFSSIGTVLVDEFEYLPAPVVPPVHTAIIAPTPPISATPDPAQVSTSILLPRPKSSALPSRTTDQPESAALTRDDVSAAVAMPDQTERFDDKRLATILGRARPSGKSLDNTPRQSPSGSTATSRSMTPQLSFDDLDEGQDFASADASLTLGDGPSCDSPVAFTFTDPPSRRASVPASIRREEHLGGGALYALQGARLWLSSEQCKTPVDRAARTARGQSGGRPASGPGVAEGTGRRQDSADADMTLEQEAQLETLSAGSWNYLECEGKRMVRARIRYEGDARRFQHLIKPEPRTFASIAQTAIRGARYMHVSPPYGPSDMATLLDQMDAYNAALPVEAQWRPKIIFEPTPPACAPDQREWLEKCCGRIHVLSPNHEELLCLFSRDIVPLSDPSLPQILEEIIRHLVDHGIGSDGSGAVIVRCGKMGSVVGSRRVGIKWLPAYWSEDEEDRVVDVTGGNAYLGGVIAGLHASSNDPVEAALYGTVAASFVVEQKGLPKRTRDAEGTATGRTYEAAGREECSHRASEEWNGDSPLRRLAVFRDRCGL